MPASRLGPTSHFRRWVRQFFVCAFVVAILVALGQSTSPNASSALAQSGAIPDSPNILNTTLVDFHLIGTQPNTLTDPLVPCTGCHVDHLGKSYSGSMMANSARDPLFRAALQIANEDAQFAGEFCIRCHVPNAWLNGRSTPTNGSAFMPEDMMGVTCNSCHRMVPSLFLSPDASDDASERTNIIINQGTPIVGSGAYIVDRQDRRRGPFNINTAAHKTVETKFSRDSLMCATCHQIDNPLLSFNDTTQEFELNTLGQAAPANDKLFPVERTYAEWQYSQFNTPGGVTDLNSVYTGLKRKTVTADGPITVCQDCHMPMEKAELVVGKGQKTLGIHEYSGGSSLIQSGLVDFWNGNVDPSFTATAQQATLDARILGSKMLSNAAKLHLSIKDRELTITIINNTGHKLPTGYAEGRRMWLELVFTKNLHTVDDIGTVNDDGTLDRPVKVWEIRQGLSDDFAASISRPELAGEGFHFALNNKVFFDNRIPPRGWTKSDYEDSSMLPVGNGVNYAEGQYTDTVTYTIPAGIEEVDVKLMYQSASGEYLEFLKTEANDLVPDNIVGTDVNWGQVVKDLAATHPITRGDEIAFNGTSIPDLGITKQIAPSGNLLPGQPIVYTINFSATSVPDMQGVGLADALPSAIKNVTVQNLPNGSTTLAQNSNAPDLTWSVTGDLVSHEDNPDNNVIKISGKVDPNINQVTLITNTVLISGFSQLIDPSNIINRSASVSATVVPPLLTFAPVNYSVAENGGTVKLTVKLDKPNPYADAVFSVSTLDGTANAGSDYTAINNQQFTIAANDTSAQITLAITNDSEAEHDQFFNVSLSNPKGAALGQNVSAKVTITNDDPGEPEFDDHLFVPSTRK